MKRKNKLIAVIGVVALVGTIGIGAFAVSANDSVANSKVNQSLSQEQIELRTQRMKECLDYDLANGRITKEQYDSMMADLENGVFPTRGRGQGMNSNMLCNIDVEKWNALTDAQREEIFELRKQGPEGKISLIDKYLEFGLIDAQKAETLKANIGNGQCGNRANGMGKGNRGGKGMRGQCQAVITE